MNSSPVTWKTTSANFIYDLEKGCLYRAMFGQSSHWFCGSLPLHLTTVGDVKEALNAKLQAEE